MWIRSVTKLPMTGRNFSDNRGKQEISKAQKRIILNTCINDDYCPSFLYHLEMDHFRYKDVEKVYYSYKSEGSIDYKVYLRPNSMYSESYLEKDRFYISKYIDRVDMDFRYDYTASAAADLSIEYNVCAYLQGLHGDENEVLWSKEYVLIPDKSLVSENATAEVKVSLPVNLDDYYEMKEALYLESEVNAPVVLNIVFNVHTRAN